MNKDLAIAIVIGAAVASMFLPMLVNDRYRFDKDAPLWAEIYGGALMPVTMLLTMVTVLAVGARIVQALGQ